MSDQPIPDPRGNDDTTRATAQLPGLDIEIVHRRAPGAEQISLHMQAVPSFAAFSRTFESASPLAFWVEVAQLMWLPFLPWLGATRAMLPPSNIEEAPPTSPDT